MASANPRPRPQIMTLTDAAAERVREIVAKAERPVVGAIQAVVAHPSNPNLAWIGTANGGDESRVRSHR